MAATRKPGPATSEAHRVAFPSLVGRSDSNSFFRHLSVRLKCLNLCEKQLYLQLTLLLGCLAALQERS